MREIKFRAWDGEEFIKTENVLIPLTGKPYFTECQSELWGEYTLQHVDLELMQYTGLKDKNGVEIYEGDIYRYKYWFNKNDFEYSYLTVCFETIDIPFEGAFHGYDLDPSYIEVVGNIYENPELLEVQND